VSGVLRDLLRAARGSLLLGKADRAEKAHRLPEARALLVRLLDGVGREEGRSFAGPALLSLRLSALVSLEGWARRYLASLP